MATRTIKLNRARKLSATGRHPATFDALARHLPDGLVAAIPARLIAETIDALHACAGEAKALARHEAVAEGAIWDAAASRHREIAA